MLELINVIDVQTQKQAYLYMEDTAIIYVNMLGTEGLENHIPTFNRKWLKHILNALPHLESWRLEN